MLLMKANVFMCLLLLYSFLLGLTDARRGRTRSRTKSKVGTHMFKYLVNKLAFTFIGYKILYNLKVIDIIIY